MSLKSIWQLIIKYLAIKKVQQVLAIIIVCVTVTLFTLFFIHHSSYVTALRQTKLSTLLVVFGLYVLLLMCLMVVYQCILLLCNKPLSWHENGLLTIYTLLVNFFGPLQSGPGFRAIYLKNKHRVRIRDYAGATFIYYGFYILFSLLFLLVTNRPWWQTVLALLVVGGIGLWGLRYWNHKHKLDVSGNESRFRLTVKSCALLALSTLAQVAITAVIYAVELRSIHPSINFGQAMTYSGAANFALFVSLTPGAIGFRETFLIFAEHLDHINTATILSANVIDRSVYIVFLALLFLLAIGINLKKRLHVKTS
ncbi:MAG: lysylphosphatidylglycerol synthase domain-containing protein [Candidatus Saccharimonadales bacterium]|jgi:uncharacterized membrane protein YbhN (UPF0104 family)